MADFYYSARDILDKAIGTDAYCQIKAILTSIKAADVVEVVRCGNCKYVETNRPLLWCWKHEKTVCVDDFCLDGVRMDKGAEHEAG